MGLGPVPINGDPLAAKLVREPVRLFHVVDCGGPGHVDGLGDGVVRVLLEGRLDFDVERHGHVVGGGEKLLDFFRDFRDSPDGFVVGVDFFPKLPFLEPEIIVPRRNLPEERVHLVKNIFFVGPFPALHRVHEPPDPKKVEDFEAFITTLGYSLAAHGHALRPKHFQKLIDRMRGTPEERPIAALMLRTMQKAKYDAGSLGHFGLATDHYTHFTSPIRRYPDLVVHRMLRESRQGALGEARREELDEELPEVARHTSEMERRADEAERELLQWKKVRFMADKVGDEYHGYVTGVAPFGLFVELIEHFVEGLVHISSMADDYYRYVEQQHLLRGENTKRVYRLGDKVLVQVVRVDMERRQVDLGLVEILEAVRREVPARPIRSNAAPKRERRRAQRPGRRERATRRKGGRGR